MTRLTLSYCLFIIIVKFIAGKDTFRTFYFLTCKNNLLLNSVFDITCISNALQTINDVKEYMKIVPWHHDTGKYNSMINYTL